MSNYNGQFYIQSERRKEEIAAARQHRLVKEAQRAGMKTLPLVSFPAILQVFPAFALLPDLTRMRRKILYWNCRLRSRLAVFSSQRALEGSSSPCGD